MERVKVAVLDSGIAKELIDDRIKGGKQFYYDYCESCYLSDGNIVDYNGHGTAFIDTLWNVFPEIDVYVVKFLGISGRASEGLFLEALKYAQSLQVDVIAIPSSYVLENIHNEVLQKCDRITKKGSIIVSAVKNGEKISHIADYENVIGVLGRDMKEEQYIFDKSKPIQMQCSFNPIVAKTSNGIRKLFQGNSKATAMATGIIAKCLYEYPGENIQSVLVNKSHKICERKPQDIFDSAKESYYCENDADYQRFVYILCEYFCENSTGNIRNSDLTLYKDGFLLRGLDLLLQLLEERYHKKLDQILFDDFRWAYLLYERYLKTYE